jgi:tetratricopeptide (TPR) repeat protein
MKQSVLFGLLGLAAGLLIGFFGANSLNRQESTASSVTEPSATQAAPQPPANTSMLPDVTETIQTAEAEPENFPAQMKTGDMYAQIGRFDKAVEFYKRGILLKPDDFNGNVVLANALFDSQKFEEAGQYYAKAVQLNPKDVNARTDLGATFVERSQPDYERAIKEFNAALDVEPKSEPAIYYLGIAHLRKGDRSKAGEILDRLNAANPNSPLASKLRQNIDAK